MVLFLFPCVPSLLVASLAALARNIWCKDVFIDEFSRLKLRFSLSCFSWFWDEIVLHVSPHWSENSYFVTFIMIYDPNSEKNCLPLLGSSSIFLKTLSLAKEGWILCLTVLPQSCSGLSHPLARLIVFEHFFMLCKTTLGLQFLLLRVSRFAYVMSVTIRLLLIII